jgi:hypothetical protein
LLPQTSGAALIWKIENRHKRASDQTRLAAFASSAEMVQVSLSVAVFLLHHIYDTHRSKLDRQETRSGGSVKHNISYRTCTHNITFPPIFEYETSLQQCRAPGRRFRSNSIQLTYKHGREGPFGTVTAFLSRYITKPDSREYRTSAGKSLQPISIITRSLPFAHQFQPIGAC